MCIATLGEVLLWDKLPVRAGAARNPLLQPAQIEPWEINTSPLIELKKKTRCADANQPIPSVTCETFKKYRL